MQLPTSDLELMQGVLDHRLGGDMSALERGLERFEQELNRPDMPLFEKVGNNCLVFFTNDDAKQVCEDNPETLQGVIVSDFNSIIKPGTVAVGSLLQGHVTSPGEIMAGSEVYYSTVFAAEIIRSRLVSSIAMPGSKLVASNATESVVYGSLYKMNLLRAMTASGGAYSDADVAREILEYDPSKDHADAHGLVGRLLAQNGIRVRPQG
ncbi:MAG: hypothetical protein QG553_281 [Patescibacteria group bacterium]|nr:hypothetical protein [Patescibacteria group bacterium]